LKTNWKRTWIPAAALGLLMQAPAFAIDAKYRQKLERSGCTQMSELQGCDINKSKAENAKAGFVNEAPAESTSQGTQASQSPYTGNWVAVGPDGSGTVAKIHIDNKEKVTVNGKAAKARRSDGALVFKQGFVTYTLQGDRRLKGEDTWSDSDAKTTGKIVAE
jgi:hypothetical protein